MVAALVTTCFTAFDMLPAKRASPPYSAATAVVPFLSAEVVKLAEPPLNVPVPSTVLKFMNVTVSPFGGAPASPLTIAVKVAARP